MPADRCRVLFYPRGKKQPIEAGTLRLLPGMKGSVFQYADEFLANGSAISFDPIALPLRTGEFITAREGDVIVPDVFSDAGPDAWGRKVLDRLAKLERSSEFDYLLAAGSNRTGALDFSVDGELRQAATAQIDDIADMEKAIDQVRRKAPIDERSRSLLALGTSVGGMRPKTFIEKDGHLWIAKFNARDEDFDAVAMEWAGMSLAGKCGIDVPPICKHQFQDQRVALLVRRFDREPLGEKQFARIPFISARALLRGYVRESEGRAPTEYSYVQLADVRRLIGQESAQNADLRELFRRMVFNILIDNTDDHERNHGFIYQEGWRLAPAFDVSSQTTGLGYQAMIVGADNTNATLANALSECGRFGLTKDEAVESIAELISSTESLESDYIEAGVSPDQISNAMRIRDRIIQAFNSDATSAGKTPVKKRKQRAP